MTAKLWEKKNMRAWRRAEPASVILLIFSLLSLFLLLRAPSVTFGRMSDALSLCVRTVVPSLFPFMVVSELLLSGDCASILSPLLRRGAKFLFGVSGESAVAILLGFFCGFPIGAKGAAALYKSGQIDGGEFERILTFSCIPSAPFLISTVGISMFGDGKVGIKLLLSCLLSSIIIGVAVKKISFSTSGETHVPKNETVRERSIARLFTSAVSSSALSMLYICAFLTFFSTFVGVVEDAIGNFAFSDVTNTLLLGFFELTGGIKSASGIPDTGKYFAAAIAGWSGLSVHFQIMSVCQGCNISMKPYFLSKLASTVLCPIFMLIFELF